MKESRPRLLDLFAGAGGSAVGYHRAGFEVVGVDIKPQPNYPFEFHQAGAFEYLHGHFREFDVVHASPPCQAYSNAQRIRNRKHPRYIKWLRLMLRKSGLPYVIENVVGAPLLDPIILCGKMFGLRTYRHRLFESSISLEQPYHGIHSVPNAKMGRPVRPGEFIQVVGHFSDTQLARTVMGTPWMTRDEMREAIPPAYTTHVGLQLIAALRRAA